MNSSSNMFIACQTSAPTCLHTPGGGDEAVEASLHLQLALRKPTVGCTGQILSSLLKEVSGDPNQAAPYNMGIFSNFMKNIGEDERWSGRTQSGASWSPEQLYRDLRLHFDTVEIEDQTGGTQPICQEISTHAGSNVRVMERAGSPPS